MNTLDIEQKRLVEVLCKGFAGFGEAVPCISWGVLRELAKLSKECFVNLEEYTTYILKYDLWVVEITKDIELLGFNSTDFPCGGWLN